MLTMSAAPDESISSAISMNNKEMRTIGMIREKDRRIASSIPAAY
jgi:hypothetical protein